MVRYSGFEDWNYVLQMIGLRNDLKQKRDKRCACVRARVCVCACVHVCVGGVWVWVWLWRGGGGMWVSGEAYLLFVRYY